MQPYITKEVLIEKKNKDNHGYKGDFKPLWHATIAQASPQETALKNV